MAWIFVALGVLLLFASPLIRNTGLTLLAVGFAVFLVIVLLNRQPASPVPTTVAQPAVTTGAASRRFDFDQYQRDKRDREDPDAKTRIPLTKVRFDQIQPVAGIDPGTLQTIRARVYNDSDQFSLTDYSYYLKVQDCLPVTPDDRQANQCTTVFDQRGTVSTIVPPNQARDILIDLTKDSKTGSSPFKLLGTPQIELTPTMTRAYVTAERG